MQKNTWVILLLVCAMIIVTAGCVGAQQTPLPPPTPQPHPSTSPVVVTHLQDEDPVRITSCKCTWGEYGWLYCKGIVQNDDTRKHSVSLYIDVYSDTDVKYDHLLSFVNVDAGGKTAFESTSTEAENYKGGRYKYYIDRIH